MVWVRQRQSPPAVHFAGNGNVGHAQALASHKGVPGAPAHALGPHPQIHQIARAPQVQPAKYLDQSRAMAPMSKTGHRFTDPPYGRAPCQFSPCLAHYGPVDLPALNVHEGRNKVDHELLGVLAQLLQKRIARLEIHGLGHRAWPARAQALLLILW